MLKFSKSVFRVARGRPSFDNAGLCWHFLVQGSRPPGVCTWSYAGANLGAPKPKLVGRCHRNVKAVRFRHKL